MRDPNLEWLEDFIEDSINSNLNSKINYAEKKVQNKRASTSGASSNAKSKMDESKQILKPGSRKSRRVDDSDSNGEDLRKSRS